MIRFSLILFISFHLLIAKESRCQTNTFIKTYALNNDNNGFGVSLQTTFVENKIYLSTLTTAAINAASLVSFTELLDNGEIVNSHSSGVDFLSDPTFSASQCFVSENNEIYYILSETPHFCIWKTTETNELLWKNAFINQDGLSNITYGVTALLTPNENFIFSRFAEARIFIGKINSTGDDSLLKKINLQRPNSLSYDYEPVCSIFHEGDVFVAGQVRNTDTDFRSGFCLKIDEDLNVETAYSFENSIVSAIDFFENGDILFFAKTAASEFGGSNLLLLKFSQNMEFIKGIELPNFDVIRNIDGIINDEQEIYYRFTGRQGGRKNIVIKFDEDLNLEWAKDFENTNYRGTKTLQSTPDERVLFAGVTNEIPNKLVLYKMTKDGEIEGYSFNELCVNEIIPFVPEVIEYTTTENTPPYEDDAAFITEENNISIIDNDFEVTNLALPDFALPNRICADNCTSPTILKNETADSVRWYFENGIPETSTQKMPGQVCFTTPGIHLVHQSVFYNNCEETFETVIEVLPEIEINLPKNQSICDGADFFLDATSAEATSYLWSNGATTPSQTINQAGTYIVTASNEACETTDTTVVNEILPEPYPIILPPDTIICRQNSPFIITPVFAATEQITWQDGQVRPDFGLIESGIYTATVDLDGCLFSASIDIEMEDCAEKIFVPNVFSPDNDGFNDIFRAEGQNFITTQMLIYDRWGELIFESNAFDATWDGRYKGDFVDIGVFVYVISYRNTLLDTDGTLSGDVSILK